MGFKELEEQYRDEKTKRIKMSVRTLDPEFITKDLWQVYQDGNLEARQWWDLTAWGMLWKWDQLLVSHTSDTLHPNGAPVKPLSYSNQFLKGNTEYPYHFNNGDVRATVERIMISGRGYVAQAPVKHEASIVALADHVLKHILVDCSQKLVDHVLKIDIYIEDMHTRPWHQFPMKVYRDGKYVVELPLK